MNVLDYSDPTDLEAQQLEQRKQLAALLLTRGADTPVFSNKAGIAKMLTQVLGGMDMREADRGQMEIAKQRQAGRLSDFDKIAALSQQSQPYLSSNMPQKDDEGNDMPGSQSKAAASRMDLARILSRSKDVELQKAGLATLLKGPEAPIIKESDGKIFVLSPDGKTLIQQYGGGKISPPNIADATPESLKIYQQTGDASVLVPRIKQQAVDTGGGTQFVNPENPPASIPKTMSPGESAANDRAVAQQRYEGVLPPSGSMDHGSQSPQIPSGVQGARDDGRMQILLQERASLAAQGKTDPALEKEISLISGQRPSGLSPKASGAVAEGTAKDLAKGGTDYKVGLDDRVRSGLDLQMRINESKQALSQFTPGMGSETRLTVARAAQALGMPDSVVQKINNGDVAAKQEFMKLSAQQAMESLKQSMGGAGRIAQAEFKVFQQNNPNIELDPRAIDKIFDFSQRVLQRDVSEQQAMTSHIKAGGNIAEWPTIWAQQQMKSGIMNGANQNTGGWSIRRIGG